MYRYYKLFKPYGVLSQFTKEHESHRVLGELFDFPKDVYPVGRLDRDSEGLLLLTNDKKSIDKILNPVNKTKKTYFVQVEGIPTGEAIAQLKSGVNIKVRTGIYHLTSKCEVSVINMSVIVDRDPPIRFRKNTPTSWLEIIISEGKNRQVRKMCAKVGYPVLRLIRHSIGELSITGMAVGEVEEVSSF